MQVLGWRRIDCQIAVVFNNVNYDLRLIIS
jgi:hypothetical protein